MITRVVAAGGILAALLALTPQDSPVRNPTYLRAFELLNTAEPGVAPRVRFEWERVPGSREYVLSGKWTDAQSWAVRAQEYRVSARNATSWGAERVTFEVSLPPGSHSWKLVAVFGPDEIGDFQNPAHLSFTVN